MAILRALLVTQGYAGCFLLWGSSLPAPGVSLNQNLSRLSLSSARAQGQWEKEGGGGVRNVAGGADPEDPGGLCCKMLPALGCTDCRWAQRLAVGFFLWCPVRYLCQASVNLWCCSLGTNALLQVCSLVSCYSDIS